VKIPEARQLPSGSWHIQMRLGGQSVSVTEPTRAACIRTAQLIKAEHAAGKRVQQRVDLTVGELIDAYIKKYADVLSPSTVRGYTSIRNYRFSDAMKKRPAEVRDWQGVINRELRVCSEHTVKNAWGLVTAALRDAKMPVPEVKLAQIPENELSFLEPEEIPKFVAAARGDLCEAEMLLELHGLRLSETLQVVKENRINLKTGRIEVRGAIVRGNDGFVQKKTNKSKAGTRPVPILIPRLEELTKEYRERGEAIPTHGTTTISRHVHQTCEKAGVTDVSNHGLRRSFASLCYSRGVNLHILQQWGGWQDLGTLHKIYIKCAQRDKSSAERDMQAFFREPTDAERLEAAYEKLRALCEEYADLHELEAIRAELAAIQSLTENAHENRK